MGITHLFYNEPTSKELKLEMIDKIMINIPLNNYITRIYYLILNKKELIQRKNMDSSKERKHFFDNLNYSDLFTPLIMLKGYPLIFYFAQLSDFCVMGFAFCSGYAHMKLFHKKNYYKRR